MKRKGSTLSFMPILLAGIFSGKLVLTCLVFRCPDRSSRLVFGGTRVSKTQQKSATKKSADNNYINYVCESIPAASIPPGKPPGIPRAFEKIVQMPGPAGNFCW